MMTIIMAVVGGIVLGLGSLFYKKAPPNSTPVIPTDPFIQEARVFFQGPFQAILDKLSTAVLALERLSGLNVELKEALGDLLKATRHDIKNVLQVMSQEADKDTESIKRQVHQDTHELSERLGRIEVALGRLEGLLTRSLRE